MFEAFGGKGYLANTREELRNQVKECLQNKQQAALINCRINPSAGKKAQVSVLLQGGPILYLCSILLHGTTAIYIFIGLLLLEPIN